MSIKILAIPCNNKGECMNDIDEKNCDQSPVPLVSSLGIGLFVTLVIAIIVVYCCTNLNILENFDIPEDQPASISKQVLLQQCKPAERKHRNQAYFQNLLDTNGGKRDEALNTIRQQFGPSITETFMNDIEDQEGEEGDQTEEMTFVDKVYYFFTSFKDKIFKKFKRYEN